ncbi:MAG TPA: hypothetical protein VK941_06585 [Gillisia sp.]|nr:hypothetical protein [Gillisia sp.]
MNRIHLFEFEDLQWFPGFLRNYGTDFLQFLSNKTKMYKPIIPILEKGIIVSNTNVIIDLGSGSGGGLLWVNSQLKNRFPDLKIILTDYYPNLIAFKYIQKKVDNITYIKESVDARKVPANLKGFRTLFLTFHHFKPNEARQILQNAINSNSPIGIFEGQERSFPSLLAMILSPITVLLCTPFIKPLTAGRFFFTYIIPIVPLFVLWDGIVSAFRTYSVKEMEQLVSELENKEEYNWEINRIRSGPGVILYLLGTKKRM